MQRLSAAKNGRHGLDSRSNDVVGRDCAALKMNGVEDADPARPLLRNDTTSTTGNILGDFLPVFGISMATMVK